jgi:hypothetical protein
VHPFGRTPRDVDAIGAGDVWVAGEQYLLSHWNGTSWTSVREQAFTGELRAIANGEQGARWAVGDAGLVVHYENGRWRRVASDDADDLLSVWASSPTEAWAVGRNGTIVRCAPSGCASVPTDFTETLWGVWGARSDAIWAVGDAGRMAFYDGTRWSRIRSPTGTVLYAVHGSSASHVWAVGDSAFEWNGVDWVERFWSGDSSNYISVYVAAQNRVFVAQGTANVEYWNGMYTFPIIEVVGDWEQVVSAVFGSGDRVLALTLSSQIYEFDPATERFQWRAGAPYTVGMHCYGSFCGSERFSAALLPGGTMRFLRTRDYEAYGEPNFGNSILHYDPARASAP